MHILYHHSITPPIIIPKLQQNHRCVGENDIYKNDQKNYSIS